MNDPATTSKQDTPGRLDETYTCTQIVTSGPGECREYHLASMHYRNLIIRALDFELHMHGDGVKIEQGKRYRVTIEELS